MWLLKGRLKTIGHWHIDYRTAPGFFMAITWALTAGIMYSFAYDLSDEMNENERALAQPREQNLAKQRQLWEAYGLESSGDENDEAKLLPVIEREKMVEKNVAKESNEAATLKDALVEVFSKLQVIVPIYSLFVAGILHTSLQAITPLIAAERALNWSEITVALLFTVWGAEIITVVFILWYLSAKISDRLMLLTSAMFGIPASASVFLLSAYPYKALLPAVFLQGISLASVVVIGRSMVSKHTNPENQATVQSMVTVATGTCNTVGPLIGSSLFTHQNILAAILSGSQILQLVLVILAFKKFKS
jgi:Na+/melibiose symporter-like transporter